jgi:hypothetical protein
MTGKMSIGEVCKLASMLAEHQADLKSVLLPVLQTADRPWVNQSSTRGHTHVVSQPHPRHPARPRSLRRLHHIARQCRADPAAHAAKTAELNAAVDALLSHRLFRQLDEDKAAIELAKIQQVRKFAARKQVKYAITAAWFARQTKRISQQGLEAFVAQLTGGEV